MTTQGRTPHPSASVCLGKASCKDCDIRQMVLFGGLSDAELDSLLQPVSIITYEPQARIYHEGDAGRYVYTLRRGVIKLVKALPNGDHRIVRLNSRSDTIGLEILLSETYRHTAIAISSTEVCRIPVEVLHRLDQRSPAFHHQLLARWQKTVDEAERFITELSTGQARSRLAHLLLDYFSDGLSEAWSSPARDDIAHMLGITIETASRLMAEFKREGMISEQDGRIVILDDVALRSIAEE